MTLKLPPDIENFVEEQVRSGGYASAQEVILAGLRLLKLQDSKNTADDFQPGELGALLAEADRDDTMPLDEVISRRRAELARARARQ